MDYNTAIEYTHSLLRFGSRPGLERIKALLCALKDPQKKLSAVHIAGTNGKGSSAPVFQKFSRGKDLKPGFLFLPTLWISGSGCR